ncbi:MAG: NAD+ diphosphatase NudC [Rhodobacteraceae bacterium HLUCCA12]|nr:MAG: NAD+ diphosphatase NudC [Rhodobacteraceae bacterium HLUCCA12]
MDTSVVFAGGWDDRAAELRADSATLAALLADGDAVMLPVWRGKPLIAGDERDRAGWLAPDSPVFDHARNTPLFLGFHGGKPHFAADISAWEPEGIDRAALAMFFDPSEHHHPDLPGDHRFAELRGSMTVLSPVDAAMAATARALFNWHRTHRFCSSCGTPSDWAMAGWQRQCPSCAAQHFPRTDPVVIMLVERGNRLLLGRSPGWPEGMYSALAGFVEPGESLEAAVRREVFEETGIRTGAVRYVASQPWPWPNSLMLGFLAEALSDAVTLDHELEDARWMTREELVDVLAGTHPQVRQPRAGAIAHFLLSGWLSGQIE